MICTSEVRKAKQRIIAAKSVIAIFTTVQRRSSRCSRNGLAVSDSGISRNLKKLRTAMWKPLRAEREQPVRHQAGTDRESVRVANLVGGNHLPNFPRTKRAAFEN